MNRNRTIPLIVAIILFTFWRFTPAAFSAIILAASCSFSDVQKAYDAASPGDTILIPEGECIWSSQLLITKAITLKGQGYNSTIIVNNYNGDGLIKIEPGSNVAIRITGLCIKRTSQARYSSIYIRGNKAGSYVLNQIRIDHCKLEKGGNVIMVTGWVEGVIDNNIFNNCNIAVRFNGDDNYSWKREIRPGTAHALFIEDNIFTGDEANREVNLNEQIYQQGGARTVTRYNTFDMTAITGSGGVAFYDSHGNQSSSDPKCDQPLSMFRGQPLIEIYENTFKAYSSSSCNGRFIGIRGGSSLIYNNKFKTVVGTPAYSPIRLAEEESGGYGTFPDAPCDSWPAEDQINNTFIWENYTYWNGTERPTVVADIKLNGEHDGEFIVKNRDYFMHEPQSSGGKETLVYNPTYGYLTGKKYGAGMTFSFSAANAYYPYSPYAYPHPLRGDYADLPEAPKDLRIR
ncbi:MAG: hypothetical protein JRI72_04540 [Deltaproteobacteria bacterium]|nr:hypothetical protein [Deltaproteobacteria bacterium]